MLPFARISSLLPTGARGGAPAARTAAAQPGAAAPARRGALADPAASPPAAAPPDAAPHAAAPPAAAPPAAAPLADAPHAATAPLAVTPPDAAPPTAAPPTAAPPAAAPPAAALPAGSEPPAAALATGAPPTLPAAASEPPAAAPPLLAAPSSPAVAPPSRNFSLPLLAESARGEVGSAFTEPAARFPGQWAWSPHAAPRAAAAPGGSGGGGGGGGGGYQCLALNSEFSTPEVTTAERGGGRLVRALRYGHWRVRWPRFAREEHAEWFSKTDLVAWRAAADPCVAQYEAHRLDAGAPPFNSSGFTVRPAFAAPPPGGAPASAPPPSAPPGNATGEPPPPPPPPPPPSAWAAPHSASSHWLYFCEPRYTEGSVVVTDAVRVSEHPGGHDCGPGAAVDVLLANAAAAFPPPPPGQPPAASADVAVAGPLFWGVIPATWTWQHWCENTLPKMAQTEAAVVWEEVWGRGNGPPAAGAAGAPPPHALWAGASGNQELLDDRFPIVARIYSEALGMAALDVRAAPLATPRLLHACAAPPLHPFLWQLGQSAVFRPPPPPPLAARRKLVYCSRRDARTTEHPGRLLVNEDAVVQLLEDECARARLQRGSGCAGVVAYNHRAFNNSLAAMAAFFSDAIAIVSPHGGCLTNVNLMPCNAGVLEIMPLNAADSTPTEPHWHMLYMQAAFLEHRYFMLPVKAHEGSRDDMLVPLEDLRSIVRDLLDVSPRP